MTDEIKVYKDQELMSLTRCMRLLLQEEASFFNDKDIVNERGRTIQDVARDMIEVYERTNTHLELHYPMNAVAESWKGVNAFSALSLKETWL